MIISTSTLELGIDVGDLDRVLQLGAPSTVASFLQRLGRTGRRPGAQRNMLFLELKPADLLRAAGLLLLHGEGYVEPIQPPPAPHHIVAQQILALTLQKGQLQRGAALAGLQALGMYDATTYRTIEDGLLEHGHLDSDGGLLFAGPETQRRPALQLPLLQSQG
ncbi:helicase-related protein, partial [Micrococcus sp. F3Y]|uniref:helicase-related protein n=1 Tax=Micrococcus sp. F3Y TaxID=3402627 RepID=UPI003AF5F0D5